MMRAIACGFLFRKGMACANFRQRFLAQRIQEVVGFNAQAFASGDLNVRTLPVLLGQRESEFVAAGRGQRHHFIGKVNGICRLFVEAQRFQPLNHNVLQIGLAAVDDIIDPMRVSESGRASRNRLQRL